MTLEKTMSEKLFKYASLIVRYTCLLIKILILFNYLITFKTNSVIKKVIIINNNTIMVVYLITFLEDEVLFPKMLGRIL